MNKVLLDIYYIRIGYVADIWHCRGWQKIIHVGTIRINGWIGGADQFINKCDDHIMLCSRSIG